MYGFKMKQGSGSRVQRLAYGQEKERDHERSNSSNLPMPIFMVLFALRAN